MKRKLILGVAVNDSTGKCSTYKNGKQVHCKAYNRWKALIQRCVCPKFKLAHPTYMDCTICDEWLVFSNFKRWLCSHEDWENLCLDKDLLVKGNKHYSPKTCVMIHRWVNNFLICPVLNDNGLMAGVHFNNQMNKYQARINNRWTGKREHLGYFDKEIDAHIAWKVRKIEILESKKHLIDYAVYKSILSMIS